MSLLIVDGYNIIFAWQDLKNIAQADLELARDKLFDTLINYCSYEGHKLLLVFDAHLTRKAKPNASLKGRNKEKKYLMVFTKRHETADNYIERFCIDEKNKRIKKIVASSDKLIQTLIFLKANRVSARELEELVIGSKKRLRENIKFTHKKQGNNIEDIIKKNTYKQLDSIRKQK